MMNMDFQTYIGIVLVVFGVVFGMVSVFEKDGENSGEYKNGVLYCVGIAIVGAILLGQ